MIEANFSNEPLKNVECIEIGKHSVIAQPDCFVVITESKNPILVVHLYLFDESDSFRELKLSSNVVVIGLGHKVHFVNTKTKEVNSHDLGCYFGHLYSYDQMGSDYFENEILVASSDRLYLFNIEGEVVWKSERLGIDGVVVHHIEQAQVFGAGEYDPPGGWVNFKLSAVDGKAI
jgi:hypothetical protein